MTSTSDIVFSIGKSSRRVYNWTNHCNHRRKNTDQPPLIVNDSVLVPLRGIFEALQASLTVNGKDIEAVRGDTIIKLTVGMDFATVNDKRVYLTEKTIVKNGRVFVPLRFVGDSLGGMVSYDGYMREGTIRSAEQAIKAVIIEFPVERFPGTAAHIKSAMETGKSSRSITLG
ncbi:copper amine oxidase N-terminal domain-containing protein [Paenibacillus macerans]|uniref:copper amine oxidase N-terminal domain-containing protein n=1 Tax=Paenibacillus macerans TaxID=44252 RepID=UPI003D3101BB